MIWIMMTSSHGNIFHVTGRLCGEFTGDQWIPTQRPVTRTFDVFFDLRLNQRLSKQSWGWWFERLSRSLWRHCNVIMNFIILHINPSTPYTDDSICQIPSRVLWSYIKDWYLQMDGWKIPINSLTMVDAVERFNSSWPGGLAKMGHF